MSVRYHNYEEVRFKDFMRGLLRLSLKRRRVRDHPHPKAKPAFQPRPGSRALKVQRLFEALNSFLSEQMMVVADVGDALFGAADLFIRHRTEFLGPAYYASMGFAVPASIGAQLACPKLRPLVLVGDGAFQMTGLELATIARYGLNPVIVVLNNSGYGTERHMQDGPYNDVWPIQYHRMPELLGVGQAFDIRTEAELGEALAAASAPTKAYCLLNVHLGPLDRSPALQRLAERLARRLGA
jgi:indolepyruvate decarboxylase